ncbi:hypothetical protein AVEN_163504-1 [Araneus ventricosus]|uniref:Uncharacterized protein n=1 Tax=Araneus ventricosus TaxID=182803 RepID=A0A4Y2BR54_ARAVE|nr:hypothetical protein AVEN_163504-1 [Araneus ventricosus]
MKTTGGRGRRSNVQSDGASENTEVMNSRLLFFLSGYLKSFVYETPVESTEDLASRTAAAAIDGHKKSGVFESSSTRALKLAVLQLRTAYVICLY